MLTFGLHFCNFDFKMWNFAIKMIRSKTQVSLYILVKAKQNPLVCPYWSAHRPEKIGQLDTPKISEVMFLLHECKNHTMGFLLSVSSTNNAPLVKVCAKSSNETIWVAYLLLLESVCRISPPPPPQVQLSKKLIPFAHTFWHLTINYSFRIEYIPFEPRFKITDHGFEYESRGRAVFSLLIFLLLFFFFFLSSMSLLTKPIRHKLENPVPLLETFPENQQKTIYFSLHPWNVVPLPHSFQTSVYHEKFFCLSQYENYSGYALRRL